MIKIKSRYCWLIAYFFWAILILTNFNIFKIAFLILSNAFSKFLSADTITMLSLMCIPLPAWLAYIFLVGILKKYDILSPIKIFSLVLGFILLTLVIMPSFLIFSCIASESNCL